MEWRMRRDCGSQRVACFRAMGPPRVLSQKVPYCFSIHLLLLFFFSSDLCSSLALNGRARPATGQDLVDPVAQSPCCMRGKLLGL